MKPPESHETHQSMNRATRKSTVVETLPKAELHLHLEGSIRPETAIELAARHGTVLTIEEVTVRYRYSDFMGFIEAFKWVTSFVRDPEDYGLITRRLAEELIRQNVVYAEITISAGVMLRRMQNVEANFAAIVQASVDASAEASQGLPLGRLRTAWIFDATRQFGADAAMEAARWAAKLRGNGVVAFGMGGDELALPAQDFRPTFDFARSEGLRVICHAGEIGGPDEVRDAVEILGAERIGHGIAVIRDKALAESLAARGVVLEVCPTSNLATGALATQTGKPGATMAEHPLAKFQKMGLRVALSTDDPAMFHTDLLSEYSHAAAMGLSNAELLQLAEQSFTAAFLAPGEKRQLVEDFRATAKSAVLL